MMKLPKSAYEKFQRLLEILKKSKDELSEEDWIYVKTVLMAMPNFKQLEKLYK